MSLLGAYNFKLSENASKLAQGQKQHVSIARAILDNCPIMTLEEAESSIGTYTEKRIQRLMTNVMENMTNLIIAGRLWALRNSEMKLYMQGVDIFKQGNHRDLMKKADLYSKLYNSQF